MIGYASELSAALTTMSKAMLENADKSKSWTVMSRFTSGSGFWKIQNKVRGIVSSFLILNETMEAGAKAMAEYNELLGTYNKIRKKVPKEVSPEALKRTAEFKDKSAIYERAFGEEGEAALLADLVKQNKNANKLLDQMEGKLALELKYSKMTFTERMKDRRERLATFMATKKASLMELKDRLKRPSFKSVRAFVKLGVKLFSKVILYLAGIALVATILMIFIRKGLKWFNETAKAIGLFDNMRKILSAVFKVMSGVFDVLVGIWRGDLMMVLGAFWNKIIPGLITIILRGALFAGQMLVSIIGGLGGMILGGINELVVQLSDYVDRKLGKYSSPVKKAFKYGTAPGLLYTGMKGISNMASGGVVGHNVLVGEGGPEIVTLPMGARVHSNSESRRMGGNTINVHVNGRVGASDMEIKDIANKVAREINLRMNRTGSVAGRF
tara:strand:- start:20138 stop:21460 length:1323 start_codon:yes stop_codon:yes gene_type:complete